MYCRKPTECDYDCDKCTYDECVRDPEYIKEIEHSRKYAENRRKKTKNDNIR